MPLHGKIVVIKRSGGDGTEFPLTATCLFGRKPDCDIRIQLPQVSKEHCRIDFNENKEVILTNLSSVNPTRVNGEVLQQPERLNHGDVITVIDRSFRFEYPPAPTPRKRSSIGGKSDFKVLQDQQVRKQSVGENRTSETSTGPELNDGTNQDGLLGKTLALGSKEEEKSTSPFGDLYQMIKKSLDVKTPRRCSISHQQTPSSRMCSPKPVSIKKNSEGLVFLPKDKVTPKKDEMKAFPVALETDAMNNGTPKSGKKQMNSSQRPSNDISMPEVQNAMAEAPSVQKRISVTPQRFTSSMVVEQVTSKNSKSPVRRSKEATPAKQAVTSPNTEGHRKASPRNIGNVNTVKVASTKRKSGELPADLPKSQMKRKRVSFGSNLSPELFDKRMPPDSPLRKGATPRRSFCLSKPKESMLRRVSVIGMIQEHPDYQSPAKMKTPSPKKSPMTQLTGKKSPRSKSPSPKAETPGKKTPKSKSPSPKAETPRAGSSYLNNLSPGNGNTTPRNNVENPGAQTTTVKGRFSVSRISTPSPTAESGDTNEVCLDKVTPKLRLKRKSMKSSARKSVVMSTVKVMCRRSIISRASMKAMNSWADIVKFGQRKAPVGRPVKTKVNKTTVKKAACKPQTPASKLKDQVTTGHAESPVTIVVGRAHWQKVACPAGAAPRWISNTGLLKMDEDLTGISEMYKTPVTERKQRAVTTENSAKTPVGELNKSVVEPSVLNTPEEPGEMMVSPLSVSTTLKDRSYNHEAVQRLLTGEHESVVVSEIPATEVAGDLPEQSTDSKMSVTTKQGPVLPNCSTGVRVKKTPRQKAEPLEDLRGKVLKTPKQKIGHQECLTGVKRIMKTPRQKAEPLEDIRGKILKTPKQKIEQQECLTGVKRIMKTPRQKAEPLEDIRGKILKTPKQKIEQQECLTGVKRIMKTPKQNIEPIEDLRGKILMTPKEKIEPQECLTGIKRIFSTPQQAEDPQDKYLESHEDASSDCVDLSGMLHSKIPPASESSLVCLSGVKRLMRTPKVKAAPVEDMVGVKRLLKTPREKGEPVADNFGIKRLMKSPKLKANAPVEDFEGLKELMKEPLVDPTEQQETSEIKDQTTDGAKGADKNEAAADDHVESSDIIQVAKESEVIGTDDSSEEKLKPQTAIRGRRAKMEQAKSVEDEQKGTDNSEESAVSAPVRGRRGKKTEATAPPVVQKSTRRRNAQSNENSAVVLSVKQCSTLSSNVACKPTRGRNARKASDDPAEIPEVVAKAEIVPELESEQTPPGNVSQEPSENLAALEKPRRGRSTKGLYRTTPENKDVPLTPIDNASHVGKEPESNEDVRLQPEVVPSESQENNSSDTTKTAPQELATIPKKSGRDRRAKVELRRIDDNQVVPDHFENPIDPGNSKRGKKAEITQQPILRKTTRSRNSKLPECKSKKVVQEESVQVSEVNAEAVRDESSTLSPHHKGAATKPTRGRKTKQTFTKPFQPEKEDAVSEEQPPNNDKAEKPCPTPGKNTRGKRTRTDDVQTAAVERREPKSAPPVRAKRGGINKQESIEKENSQSQESVKNLGRSRKVEQDPVEPSIVHNYEQELSKEAETPVDAEPTKVEPNMATRARRAQKAGRVKQLAETDDVHKSAAISVADKPTRGRRGKPVVEDMSEEKPTAEDENNKEQKATVVKRRVRSVKDNVPETIPAKRARRGASLPPVETKTESANPGLKSESYSKELPKRGRRAAKPSADVAELCGEELKTAVGGDGKMPTKSVKWKSDVEVFEDQKVTPVKPVRGRKSKVGDRVDTKGQKDSGKIEEEYLSDKVEVQATKRARRGVVIVEGESTSKEPETQPKTRRGRLAKK